MTQTRAEILLGLSLLSGVCGLAYEILFVRQISNIFGNGVLVTGLTLTAVFFGIALGVLLSARITRLLWLIELSIGLCAIGTAVLFATYGFDIGLWGGSSAWAITAKIAILLALPMVLIGACVPLFADRLPRKDGFVPVYMLYNLGAALSVLLVEFWLFRSFGIYASLLGLGCQNLMLAATLLVLRASPESQTLNWPKLSKPLLAFVLASFASGIFQLFVLKYTSALFGPLNENFALLLFYALIGIALGTWAQRRYAVFLQNWLLLLVGTLALTLLSTTAAVSAWVALADASTGPVTLALTKILLFGVMTVPAFIAFGGLIPATLPYASYRPLLLVSSLGNGVGALLGFAVLYSLLPGVWMGMVVLGLALVACLLISKHYPIIAATIAAALVAILLWPAHSLSFGYRSFLDKRGYYTKLGAFEEAETFRAYDQDVSIIRFGGGFHALVLNGYQSLMFGPDRSTALQEMIVGAVPAAFASKTDQALVLGLGSGITAGATSVIFTRTTVAEINPAMLSVLTTFADRNSEIASNPKVDIRIEDGIATLLTSDQRYDTIVNTVTSPKFYSAAKLYSADVLHLIRSRLHDGGVYSSWFDVTIGPEGIRAMKATLEHVFPHCRYFLLSSGYFNVVCGEAPLLYQSSAAINARLQGSRFVEEMVALDMTESPAAFLSALEIDLSSFDTSNAPISTLNKPVFEFGLTHGNQNKSAGQDMMQHLEAGLAKQRSRAFAGTQWKTTCRVQQRAAKRQLKVCAE